jgi:hypothetical protein
MRSGPFRAVQRLSVAQSHHRCNKLLLPANRRRIAHRWAGMKGDISTQNPVFWIQYLARYEHPRSAPKHHPPLRLVTTCYMCHPAQHSAASASVTPQHPTAVPSSPTRYWLASYAAQLSLRCTIGRQYRRASYVWGISLTWPFAAPQISKEKTCIYVQQGQPVYSNHPDILTKIKIDVNVLTVVVISQ